MSGPARMCAVCDEITDQPVRAREVHSDCGPGRSVYMCEKCAQVYPEQSDPVALLDIIAQHRSSKEGDR